MRSLHLVFAFAALSVACDTAATGPRGPAGPPGADGRIAIHLPGRSFFPEGVAAASDGTLYVGSNGTGAIVKVPPNALGTEEFVPARPLFAAYGMSVDEARNTLWVCSWDDAVMPAQPAYLRAFALDSGAETGAWELPGELGFCNDVVHDAAGNVYATDTLAGTVLRLAPGATALETWSADEAFEVEFWTFSLNGLVLDGAGGLYVVKYDDGGLFRIPIANDGSAGEPVAIPVTPPLVSPDGIERLDANHLLVVEHELGQVSIVTLADGAGTKEIIANGFAEPTTAGIDRGSAWVAEGQFRYFGTEEVPDLPFKVHRVALP